MTELKLRQIWITWLGWYPDMVRKSTICKRHAVNTLNWFIIYPTRGKILEDSIEFNWPSPRRLFLLAPRLPEVSGIVQRPTVISDEVGCVLKSGFVQHQCGGKSAPSVWSPRWSAVTGLNSALIAMVSGLGMRFPDKDMYKRDRCSGYFFVYFKHELVG